jgi:hypothetical protein
MNEMLFIDNVNQAWRSRKALGEKKVINNNAKNAYSEGSDRFSATCNLIFRFVVNSAWDKYQPILMLESVHGCGN